MRIKILLFLFCSIFFMKVYGQGIHHYNICDNIKNIIISYIKDDTIIVDCDTVYLANKFYKVRYDSMKIEIDTLNGIINDWVNEEGGLDSLIRSVFRKYISASSLLIDNTSKKLTFISGSLDSLNKKVREAKDLNEHALEKIEKVKIGDLIDKILIGAGSFIVGSLLGALIVAMVK